MSTKDIGGNMWDSVGVCYKNSTIIGDVIKHQSDATSTWKSIVSSVKFLGHGISRVRMNNDTALIYTKFTHVCESEGIAVKMSVPYSH